LRIAPVLSVLLVALAAPPAAASRQPARPVSGWDGGTLGGGEAAAFAGLGWPEVEAGVRVGVADALDLGLEGSWQYARGWLEVDATARYLIFGRRGVAFSALGRVGWFRATGHDGPYGASVADHGPVLGLGLGAGFLLGEELITGAVEVPFAVGVDEGTRHLPLLLSLGLDHPLELAGGPASLGFGLQAGPWSVGGGGDSPFFWAFALRGTYGL
jgi:hypothetical protein